MDAQAKNALDQVKRLIFGEDAELLRVHDMLGLTEKDLEATYVSACRQLTASTFMRAAKTFAMLIVLDHDDGRYWRGLAVAMHRMKALPIAETLYTITLRIDPSDLISRVFRAEVMAQQGRRTAAWLELEATLELFKAHPMPEHAAYKQRAETLAASIKSTDASAAEVEK
ncbi:MAG: hypothetical protein IT381_05595 [Deltaproteobacteria bacterium]|nr:hypothetical protein [Deltaproteobacteria bacterium]